MVGRQKDDPEPDGPILLSKQAGLVANRDQMFQYLEIG
jgi:hypothetical protein